MENQKYNPVTELSEEEMKSAKKIAKKKNIDLETVIAGKKQAANYPIAQQLVADMANKLQELGFALEFLLDFQPTGIRPVANLRPLNANELQHFANEKALKAQEQANQPKND